MPAVPDVNALLKYQHYLFIANNSSIFFLLIKDKYFARDFNTHHLIEDALRRD